MGPTCWLKSLCFFLVAILLSLFSCKRVVNLILMFFSLYPPYPSFIYTPLSLGRHTHFLTQACKNPAFSTAPIFLSFILHPTPPLTWSLAGACYPSLFRIPLKTTYPSLHIHTTHQAHFSLSKLSPTCGILPKKMPHGSLSLARGRPPCDAWHSSFHPRVPNPAFLLRRHSIRVYHTRNSFSAAIPSGCLTPGILLRRHSIRCLTPRILLRRHSIRMPHIWNSSPLPFHPGVSHLEFFSVAIPFECHTPGILLRQHSTQMSHIRNSTRPTFHLPRISRIRNPVRRRSTFFSILRAFSWGSQDHIFNKLGRHFLLGEQLSNFSCF